MISNSKTLKKKLTVRHYSKGLQEAGVQQQSQDGVRGMSVYMPVHACVYVCGHTCTEKKKRAALFYDHSPTLYLKVKVPVKAPFPFLVLGIGC